VSWGNRTPEEYAAEVGAFAVDGALLLLLLFVAYAPLVGLVLAFVQRAG